MSEPETITLRRLPPEHVLRKDVDMLKHGLYIGPVSITAGENVKDVNAACYCRAEDYPPEYDKPAVDPGEGWRIYDQHKEGREPRPVIEFMDIDGKWKQRPFPFEDLTKTAVYRVPVTPQPDRLTELRQQGERQAKRIVELEASEKELKEKLRILKHNHSEQGKALTEQGEYIESLQTQVRSAEEALRVEKQKHDEAVMQLEKSIDVYDHGVTQIYNTLNDVLPSWYRHDGNAYDDACDTIRWLAELNKPLRWERRRPTEEEAENQIVLERVKSGHLFAWEKSEQPATDFENQICILPPIAEPEPEPEPKMITQRRWLVKSRHSWEEIWIFPEDRQPCSTWMETIRTNMTRKVPG